eukprot:TRINITY_DN4405_c0_g2_i2.p1 TRINITY_DN4405_c0_g2~~TRINITY_DN4405_c0_g2_i2.p1  ORF type:complete len:152 (+),score=9.07 TRINITY_DN4405_c0_g2_i2:406-861(+)
MGRWGIMTLFQLLGKLGGSSCYHVVVAAYRCGYHNTAQRDVHYLDVVQQHRSNASLRNKYSLIYQFGINFISFFWFDVKIIQKIVQVVLFVWKHVIIKSINSVYFLFIWSCRILEGNFVLSNNNNIVNIMYYMMVKEKMKKNVSNFIRVQT